MIAERVLMGLLLGGIAIGCVVILHPFFSAILWAAILVFTSWPVFAWLRALGFRRVGASLTMVLLAAVLVVLPLALAVPGGASDATRLVSLVELHLRDGLPSAPGWLARLPVLGVSLSNLWNGWAADLSVMVAFFQPWFGTLAEAGLRVLLGVANGILSFVLALFIAFFFYIYGDPIAFR